jgi:arylsulfatase A-like enzyme
LAGQGIRFTDGHAASSVCTPSRYSLLTGQYAFRNRLGSSILPGDAPLAIKPGSYTLPQMFRTRGYATGFVGKWHLGLGGGGQAIPWNGELKPGPEEIGFQQTFYFPATGDRVPTVFVRNHRVVNLDPKDPITISYRRRIGNEPTGITDPDLATVLRGLPGHGHLDAITNGVTRIGFMTGGKSALWKDEEMSDTLTAEAVRFIERHRSTPFFLYFAPHGIHEPRVPAPRFRGKSGAGTYGDFIAELDDSVDRVMEAIDRLHLAGDTLVIFSSDNGGCSWMGYDYGDRAGLNGHRVNGVLRGEKGSIWEGGTREPFIVRWPGRVPSGMVSPALVSQTDLLASLGRLIGARLPGGEAGDSMDVLDALLGTSRAGRHELVEHQYGVAEKACALRVDNWKWIDGELYNLADDLSERHDLAKQQPERAKAMAARLKEIYRSPGDRRAAIRLSSMGITCGGF